MIYTLRLCLHCRRIEDQIFYRDHLNIRLAAHPESDCAVLGINAFLRSPLLRDPSLAYQAVLNPVMLHLGECASTMDAEPLDRRRNYVRRLHKR